MDTRTKKPCGHWAVVIKYSEYCIINMFIVSEVKSLSRVRLFATQWTVAHQAPLSMGFSRQEYWSDLPCSPPGDLPNLGIEPRSPSLQADSLPAELPGKPKKIWKTSIYSS